MAECPNPDRCLSDTERDAVLRDIKHSVGAIQRDMQAIKRDQDRCLTYLFGPENDPQNGGARQKLHDLIDAERRREKFVNAAILTGIAALVTGLINIFRGGGSVS